MQDYQTAKAYMCEYMLEGVKHLVEFGDDHESCKIILEGMKILVNGMLCRECYEIGKAGGILDGLQDTASDDEF